MEPANPQPWVQTLTYSFMLGLTFEFITTDWSSGYCRLGSLEADTQMKFIVCIHLLSCSNKLLQSGWSEAIGFYSVTLLKARSLRSVSLG